MPMLPRHQSPSPQPPPKRAVFAELRRIGKALASPLRLELLDLLAQTPRTVSELVHLSEQEVANVSHHLQVLRGARLVAVERRGTQSVYRLEGDLVGEFLIRLHQLGIAQLAEVERIARDLAEHGPREEVDGRTLLARVARGDVILIDVRPFEEYRANHIPGALSFPLPELVMRLDELPADREVVAYCRGRFCVMAGEAVTLLRRRGRVAYRLEDGVLEWRSRGLAVVSGESPSAPARRRRR